MTSATAPTLTGWVFRDFSILAVFSLLLAVLGSWHAASPGWLSYALGAGVGFVAAYVVCYVSHEWGHLIGARSSGADMPLAPYRGVPIGYFDVTRHTQTQFLALSWGGVIGYLVIAGISVALYFGLGARPVTAGLAVGGLAFIFQSLSVDLPQIFKVLKGADPLETNKTGASAAVILKRTWQSWLVLAVLLVAWNTFS